MNDNEPSEFCTRRTSSSRSSVRRNDCRYFATFRTSDPAIQFVEFTVVAPSRKQAAQLARKAAKPLGLSMMEMD